MPSSLTLISAITVTATAHIDFTDWEMCSGVV
jgi:hypothetical protein